MKTDPQLPTTKTTAARRTVPMTTEMPSRTPATAQTLTFSPLQRHCHPSEIAPKCTHATHEHYQIQFKDKFSA